MKKLLTNLSLLIGLGIASINTEYVEASNNLARCFNNQVNFKTVAHYEAEKTDYYLVKIISSGTNSRTNVIKVDSNEHCSTVVGGEEIYFYPLSSFLGKEIAYNLLTSKYLTLIEQHGGKEAFTEALLGELDAASPNNFFEDTVIVLKRLGIDLKEKVPNLIIVGEEGIPGNPHLQFGE